MKEFIEKLIGRLERNAFPLTYNFRTEKYLKFDKAKEIVKDLAEEYKGGWIPCGERLPENCEDVLLSCLDDEEALIQMGYYSKKVGWCIYEDYEFREVIAWQPLPQPYKEEGVKNE